MCFLNQKVYYINFGNSNDCSKNAGAKAPNDIYTICKNEGMIEIKSPIFPAKKNRIYQKIWALSIYSKWWRRLVNIFHDRDVIIFQYPMHLGPKISFRMLPYVKKNTGCKYVAIVHDLNSLRNGKNEFYRADIEKSKTIENNWLSKFDVLICHNEHMKKYLVDQGFDNTRLVNLEIFDYLTSSKIREREKNKFPSIAIAGNLIFSKSSYIYKIIDNKNDRNTNLKIHLYGVNYDQSKAEKNMSYHGSFTPEELPEYLEGDFGLVWDGYSTETCTGITGEYLKYNNPHKTSLYLSAGMPVIVWRKAAIAVFVIENGVGIVVDSLLELDKTIESVSEKEYKKMCENAYIIAKKLRSGYYFKKALSKSVDIVNTF